MIDITDGGAFRSKCLAALLPYPNLLYPQGVRLRTHVARQRYVPENSPGRSGHRYRTRDLPDTKGALYQLSQSRCSVEPISVLGV